MRRRLRWLPPLAVYGLDTALTLAGQSAEYWAGNHAAAVEANPLAFVLLEASPWLFLTLAAAWAVAFLTVIGFARDRIARTVAYLIAAGHTLGAASWLIKLDWPGIAAAVLLALAIERTLHRRSRSQSATPVCPG